MKVIANSQGKVVVANNKALAVQGTSPDPVLPKYTGHVDTAGLTALGWDSYDIQWLQDHVWWDAEDDAFWAVTEANKAFGPNGTTPITWSNYRTYQYDSNLRYFPKLAASTAANKQTLFSYFPHIVAIPAEDWDMSTTTGMQQMFTNCSSLRSLGDISQWDTSNVTNMRGIFSRCPTLESLDLSGWDTSSVTTFNEMFGYCTSLKELDVSSFSLGAVTDMASMFVNCVSLESLKLPKNKTASSLTTMSSLVYCCFNLKSLDISGLNAPNLTTIQYITGSCYSLQSAKIDISSTSLTNLTYALTWCNQVTTIDLTSINTNQCAQAGVGTADYQSLFYQCYKATTIKLGSNFFNGTFTTLYATTASSWSRDSIYESLYTNQTSRSGSSTSVTVKLATAAYDRLSASDISDITTKNITLTRG